MRALVTGAGGFVGRHLVAHLGASGHEVAGTDRADGGPDLLDDQGLADLLAGTRPEVVFHLAAQADVASSWQHQIDTFRANAEGTLRLLLHAAEAGVRRVIAVSSADVYGEVADADLPIVETHPLQPLTPYGVSKAAAELVCTQVAAATGLEVVRVRAFNHLGPGQSTRFVAAALAQRLLEARAAGRRAIAVGNLGARRDFTDVRDVVAAYELLGGDVDPSAAYNVCSGIDRSIQELADLLVELVGGGIDLEVDPALYRPIDTPRLIGDPSRLRAATGWEPRIPLDQTLTDLLAELRTPTTTR